MTYSLINLRLTGAAPLLVHSAQLADPLSPFAQKMKTISQKRRKTTADHEKLAELEWYGSLWVANGQLCIPAEVIEAAAMNAARTKGLGKAVAAGLYCGASAVLQHQGPSAIDDLWKDEIFRFRAPVRVKQARVMRTRPIFREWSAEVELHFSPELLDEAQVIELLRVAGRQFGLGDWRPRFGRFEVSLE